MSACAGSGRFYEWGQSGVMERVTGGSEIVLAAAGDVIGSALHPNDGSLVRIRWECVIYRLAIVAVSRSRVDSIAQGLHHFFLEARKAFTNLIDLTARR